MNQEEKTFERFETSILEVQKKMNNFRIIKGNTYNYFLGITGSGKSAAINYLMLDTPLQYEKARLGKYSIKNPKGHYPRIGHSH